MNRSKNLRVLSVVLLFGALSMLFGCGESSVMTPMGSKTISGKAIKGPVSGATVTAFAILNGLKDAPLASAVTDTTGAYSLSIGDYTGPVMLLLSSGTFTDEASGTMMPMASGDVMTAAIPSVSADSAISDIQINPLTSMAQVLAQNMPGGMTADNIAAANTAVGNFFSISDILHTVPINPLVPGSGMGASTDMINCGMVLAALSEYSMNIGMSSSSNMVTAMMRDASDGMMNGMMGSSSIVMSGMTGTMGMGGGTMMQPAAGTTGMSDAMSAFLGSPMNESGLSAANMQPLMDRLNASNGAIL